MNQDETIAHFNTCEAARKQALDDGKSEDEAHEAAKAVWNTWADELLAQKKELEDKGEWKVKKFVLTYFRDQGNNEPTQEWLDKAHLDFSGLYFSKIKNKLENRVHKNGTEPPEINGNIKSIYYYSPYFIFHGYKFPSYANFLCTTFDDNADFTDVTFEGTANFFAATFKYIAYFGDATFKSITNFRNTTFENVADFEGTKFTNMAEFQETMFKEIAHFEKATFENTLDFKNTKFEDIVNFKGITFKRYTDFNFTIFNKYTDFSNTKFERYTSFHAIESKVSFDLSNAHFEKVPDFRGAKFDGDEPPNLDHVFIRKRPWWGCTSDQNLAAKFRKLKKMAIQAHNSDAELEFHAQEMRNMRFLNVQIFNKPFVILKFWLPRVWFGMLYGFFSNYGRSVIRPLLTWGILVLIFTCIYLSETPSAINNFTVSRSHDLNYMQSYAHMIGDAISNHKECISTQFVISKDENKKAQDLITNTNAIWEALYLSIKNGFVFIDWDRSEAALRTFGCLYGLKETKTTLVPIVPWNVSIANIIQNILSAILIFLFGLALRNMLKLK